MFQPYITNDDPGWKTPDKPQSAKKGSLIMAEKPSENDIVDFLERNTRGLRFTFVMLGGSYVTYLFFKEVFAVFL